MEGIGPCIKMREDDGQPEHAFSNNCYNVNNSPSDRQGLSQKDLFEDDLKEERTEEMNRQPKFRTQYVPPVAVQEKIVIFIDTSHDMAVGYKRSVSNKIIEAPTIMKEALRVFFTNKLALSKETVFALVSIQPGKVQPISQFSSDVEHLVKSLSEMNYETNEEGITDYDITPIFSIFDHSIDLPEPISKKIPPDYVVRVIFIYNNSRCIPRLNEVDKSYEKFLNSPCGIFDVVYLHEEQSDFNSVLNIYEQLSKIISPRSYLLECSRNGTLVFNTFAKLLAHPYQRISRQSLLEL